MNLSPRAGGFRVIRHASACDFLAAAEPFLLSAEVENNLILGITRDLVADSSGLMTHPYFGTVEGGEGMCMAAFQTVPGKVAITPAPVPDAVSSLADDVDATCAEITWVIGPDSTAGEFSHDLAGRRGLRAEVRTRQRIHELRRVEALPSLPTGTLRPARSEDTSFLVEWMRAFQEEIGEPNDARGAVVERVARTELYLWHDRGACSMAGWTGRTPNGVRVNAVYTPREVRGRGYATATVAALSQLLLDQGHRFCCLYTDLANPTSNAIYNRIGYQPVSDSTVFQLSRES
jgi:GNAT superfamily N-acetyltransferase